jgi:hypothetical protein
LKKNKRIEEMKAEYQEKCDAAKTRQEERKAALDAKIKEHVEADPDYTPPQEEIDEADRLSEVEEPE